ncbi:glycosyltransferase [Paramaledivibacter caminithermalis]|uniref:Glycosyl transferase family 2 n=1 Tax=Paramaledivibacter caminithermalis (strain DSM 15212 / CIP 107654 / DViRD3) TaxID=1121301 RepID=A0A1M6L6F9_PARC5|nr:glycosyltransferase [Paramaledivibacter caminithermalis]SHJ66803.1 Glycosyl transferase family 2 [Paramaledivibacter caminithermalis DSM 15212]
MLDRVYPKITIITICLNREKTIEQTIKSVLSQSYKNIEYIIVDGASTDGTIDIINRYKEKIDIIISEPDDGISDAYNKALKYATGDIIYFLSADDYLYEDDIIFKVAKVFSEKDLDFIHGKVLEINEESGFSFVNGHKMTMDDFKRGECTHHQGFFAKKHLFDKYDNFDNNFKIIPDVDFMIKCFNDRENRYIFFDEIVAVYRWGIGVSSSPKTIAKREKEHKYILYKNFNIIDVENEVQRETVREFYKTWLEKILLQDRGITSILKEYGVRNIAIFGTRHTGKYLLSDCKKEGFNVVAFLDNNENMQGKEIEGIKIYSPKWILENRKKVDTIIVSIENNADIIVINQLKELIGHEKIKILSWKELIGI